MHRIGEAKRQELVVEPLLGYHPCVTSLTCSQVTWLGDNVAGSLIRAVASERVSEAPVPQNGWKPFAECKGRRELDHETDGSGR